MSDLKMLGLHSLRRDDKNLREQILALPRLFPSRRGICRFRSTSFEKDYLSPVWLRNLRLFIRTEHARLLENPRGFILDEDHKIKLDSLHRLCLMVLEDHQDLIDPLLPKIREELSQAFQHSLDSIEHQILSADRLHGSLWQDYLTLHGIQQDALGLIIIGHVGFQEEPGCSEAQAGHSIRKIIAQLSEVHGTLEALEIFKTSSPFLQSKHFRFTKKVFESGSAWLDLVLFPKLPWEAGHDTQFEVFEDIRPNFDLPEIVLPPKEMTHIKALISRREAQRNRGSAEQLTFAFEGPSGTGKSLLANHIAMMLGMDLLRVQVAESAQELLPSIVTLAISRGRTGNKVVVFEEADRLLEHHSNSRFSPPWMKILFEQDNEDLVAIFITNGRVNEDFIRRTSYLIRFSPPMAQDRARILSELIKKNEWTADLQSPELIQHLAEKYPLPGGFHQKALHLARALEQGPTSKEVLHEAFEAITKTLGLKPSRGEPKNEPLILNPIERGQLEDLERAARHLLGRSRELNGAVSAVFHGVSGTGKTLAARTLADRLGHKIIKVSPGDVLSRYLGENERRVRDLFAQAEADQAVLFFDEAETLFAERDGAERAWMVSLTNELLRQTEDFQGVLLLATNDLNAIDPAFSRRIMFQIEFKLPGMEERLKMWTARRTELDLSDDQLSDLAAIETSGGEIARIVQRAHYLDQKNFEQIRSLCVETSTSGWNARQAQRRVGI